MRRIWCEFQSPQVMMQPWLLELLKKYDIVLNYKVEYNQWDEGLFEMLKAYNQKEIPIYLWLTLSDEDGYWINEKNCKVFQQYIMNHINSLKVNDTSIQGICVDLEPPLPTVKALTEPGPLWDKVKGYSSLFIKNFNSKRYGESVKIFTEIAHQLRLEKIKTMAVGSWTLYYDKRFNTSMMQNMMETPFFDVPWDEYNLMYYGTLMRQQFHWQSAESIDHWMAQQVTYLRKLLGNKLSVSIGCTNIGKLGTEAYYTESQEMHRDILGMKCSGVDDMSLFSLDGLMEPQKLEEYLSIFCT